ncbi:cation-translocating P-type ATPase [Luteolibacter pohnpeiensis]|uniref:P-type Zn(2+) transporter n=1 Tax=Luteolibacter pohnpeiensis TaxID=454153 RepID=A0A934VTZ8_9BACT|nr:cation-translocating P-type ATPase [Luteolibacter pohnpeiensis]MBK1882007.1 cation-translocating P-type ATPase [Luteolibacter pohnpeiensis]
MNQSQAASPTPVEALPEPAVPLFSGIHLRATLVAIGVVCFLISLLLKWMRPDQQELSSLWAMAGLALSALPVFYDSLTSLKSDGFEATRYYMDQFVALAILACFATSQYATGIVVAAILIIGQILEERATLGVEEAIQSLTRLTRVKARRVCEDGSEETVDSSLLQPGNTIRLRPGDTVGADAEILTGHTTLDQASITGESLPVDAAPGTRIYAGTTNLTGSVDARVLLTGGDTVLGHVAAIVEEAKTSRAPVMRLIDDYTRYYMPVVLILVGFVLFFTRDVQRAISVIIVAMPCAFVLASPAAMVAALAVASRMGVLVKSSRSFEVAQGIDTVVFDKTGTLTTGRLAVTAIHPSASITESELLTLAASLEAGSTHPIARAIITATEERNLSYQQLPDITEVPGQGIHSGPFAIGRREFLSSRGIETPDTADTDSALHLAGHGVWLGSIQFIDTLRTEAKETVEALRQLGIEECLMLTGDRPAVAREISDLAGLDRYVASCLPQEKLEEVLSLKEAGRSVLVIGDGVNDAPALAAGDLGVAMGALGSDVAIKTSDIALMGNDLRHLSHFLALSDRTLSIINQNLLWGFLLIVLFIIISALGLVSPIIAACLHEFSAFFVIFNSARLLRFDEAS